MDLHLSHPPRSLDGFPERRLEAGARLWTVHPDDRWPWSCAADGDGRFDLEEPWGTCYLSMDPLGALIECCCRRSPEVDEDALLQARLSVMRLDRDLRLADVAHPRSFGYGVTAEVHSIGDYAATQAWARAFREAGFDGVHYLLRHDPSRSLRGVARFGPAGERREWPRPDTGRFGEGLLREAAERFGIRYSAARTSAAARSPDSTAPSM
ncbi:MAG TPA: RES family NAD+ phosphorylase [Egibacteraceae bacterium]|nr:RES family NAD+ phosphorylase [Egibacteraceae bacterium]